MKRFLSLIPMPSGPKPHLTQNKYNYSYQLLSGTKAHTPLDVHEPSSPPLPDSLQEAIFAAGSFCELEAKFGLEEGVVETATGYYGGILPNPSFQQVSQGSTGHTEAVKVVYDARRISYKSLCRIFWRSHDPTNRDFLAFGTRTHLRSAIFYGNDGERRLAVETKVEEQVKLSKRIVTAIIPRGRVDFQLAEENGPLGRR